MAVGENVTKGQYAEFIDQLKNTKNTIHVMACVLYGEADGRKEFKSNRLEEMRAIAWVVKNRSLKHHTTMQNEILKPKQFSCFNFGNQRALRRVYDFHRMGQKTLGLSGLL